MPRSGSSQFINRPIDEVFSYVAHQTKTTSWCLGMAVCRLTTNGEINNGAKRHVQVKSSLGAFAWDFDLVEYIPNEVIATLMNAYPHPVRNQTIRAVGWDYPACPILTDPYWTKHFQTTLFSFPSSVGMLRGSTARL